MAFPEGIAAKVPQIIPLTWDALRRATIQSTGTQAPAFGDTAIQEVVDDVLADLFGEDNMPDVAAQDALPRKVQRWIAKLVSIELLTAGLEIFREAPISKNTTGSAEVITWEPRQEEMRKLRTDLLVETRGDEAEMLALLNLTPARQKGVPLLNTIDDEFITPSHQEFPRPFARTNRS